MTTKDEALKLMIEVCKRAINYSNNVVMHEGVLFDDDDDLPFIEDALAAGKEALAQPTALRLAEILEATEQMHPNADLSSKEVASELRRLHEVNQELLGDMNMRLQWDDVPQAFNDWWDAEYDATGNPFQGDTHAYWAWAGWKAALAEQPEQDGKCKYCTDGCVACSAKAQPEQETEEQRLLRRKWFGHRDTEHLSFAEAVDTTMEKLYSQPEQWEDRWGCNHYADQKEAHPVNAKPLYTTPPNAQPEQEPVAWADHGVVNWILDKQFKHASLLYTTPPKHEWVGLTDDEIEACQYEIRVKLMGAYDYKDIYRVLEAKLKEKNNG